jgi:SAM-dependent methyltransferase
MLKLLLKIYGKLERWLVPELRFSQYVFAEILEGEIAQRPVWLDLGCGRCLFPDWMANQQSRVLSRTHWVVGVDVDADSLRDHVAYRDKALASAYQLPFAAGSFDLVSANMVVEHLAEPARLLEEVRRVLKPGGRFLFHTPNRDSWLIRIAARVPERIKLALIRLLEQRVPEDVFPTHYRFNRKPDIEALASQGGFRVIRLDLFSTCAATAALGPVALFELLWIRRLARPEYAKLRTQIMAVLEVSGPN